MKLVVITIAGLMGCQNVFASQAIIVEYRLEAKSGGVEHKWSPQVAGGSEAKPRNLETETFLSSADIKSFDVKASKSPPSKPESYEIELVHTDEGMKKFTAVADKDRERNFCVIIGGEIYNCSGFTPAVKGLWNKSTTIHGPFKKAAAERLVSVLKSHR